MKKLEYVYIGRQLKATKGIEGRYGYAECIVSGFERNGLFFFVVSTTNQNGRDKLQTGEVREVLELMTKFEPKQTAWKLVKKPKKAKKVKQV
jgi:hypothetical protein